MHQFPRPARLKEPNILIESCNLTLDHILQIQRKAGRASVEAMRISEIGFKMTRDGNPFWRKAPVLSGHRHLSAFEECGASHCQALSFS